MKERNKNNVKCTVIRRTEEDQCAGPMQNGSVAIQQSSERMLFCGIADGSCGGIHAAAGGRASLSALEGSLHTLGIANACAYPFPDELPYLLMRSIRDGLLAAAASHGGEYAEYGSTLLAAAIDPQTESYLLCSLGSGNALGVRHDGSLLRLCRTPPVFCGHAPCLTISENAVAQLGLAFGSVSRLKRMLLFDERAGKLCRGSHLDSKTVSLFADGTRQQIADFIQTRNRMHDATCILLEF